MTVPPADHPDLFVGVVFQSTYGGNMRMFDLTEAGCNQTKGEYFAAWKLHTTKSKTYGDSYRWVRLDRMLSGDIGVFPWEASPHTKMVEGDL